MRLPRAHHRPFVVLALAAATLAATAAPGRAQRPAPPRSLRLELHGGVGTTVVDRNKWSGYSDANLNDWNLMNYQGDAQLLLSLPRLQVGAEVGYQYFWWYTYTYFITTTNYRTVDVAATHLHAIVRLPLGRRASFEVGAGPYFFDGGTDFGGHAALGLDIPLGPRTSIPLRVRLDAIPDSEGGTMLPIAVMSGVAFRL